jgi:hypothetical protein
MPAQTRKIASVDSFLKSGLMYEIICIAAIRMAAPEKETKQVSE